MGAFYKDPRQSDLFEFLKNDLAMARAAEQVASSLSEDFENDFEQLRDLDESDYESDQSDLVQSQSDKTRSRIAFLTADEEIELIRAFQERGDQRAARKLIDAFKPFIHRYVKVYGRSGSASTSPEDRFQCGVIGFLDGLSKFDLTRGVRLATYIRFAVKDAIISDTNSNHVVSMNMFGTNRKIAYRLLRDMRRAKKYDGASLSYEDLDAIAFDLSVDTQRVIQAFTALSNSCRSLDIDTEAGYTTRIAAELALSDGVNDPEGELAQEQAETGRRDVIEACLSVLNERERHIIDSRFFCEEKTTLANLAQHYHLSAEGIRKIEKGSLVKMRAQAESLGVNINFSRENLF